MNQARVAGSDTREAFATLSIRWAAVSAMLAAGPGIAAAIGASAAWSSALEVTGILAWFPTMTAAAGAALALATWRRRTQDREHDQVPGGMEFTVVLAAFGIVVAAGGDARLAALTMPVVVLVSLDAVARAARVAVRGCVPDVGNAASGIIVAFGLGGIIPGLHIVLVATGAGLSRGAGWSAAYLLMGGLALIRARRALPADRLRIADRHRTLDDDGPDGDVPAIGMRAITVAFGPNVVLDRASMSVAPGELVALVGANGAGKSTILRVASGFVLSQTGQITVAGEDVTTLRPEERAAAGVSFVSGARPVFPDLTVLQNLRAAAYMTHKTNHAFETATASLLGLVPTLAGRRDAKAGVLSGGEQRLLAVTQTMYRRPAVLLADELTLGLDHDARLAVMDLLRVLADQGVAVIAVDHDLPSLLPRADRVALLAGGTITMHDDPTEILRQRTDLLPATFLAGVE